ncbi:uncharacterized protein [Sinocyclocheilus grahami]|nr:PREDICTED: uncharacterized protein LOC107572902 isoform X2 [Sinocyclocheilus grahami]
MKKIDVNGKPHLCLFALKDIKGGEEITYDYGGDDCPWRTQKSSVAANSRAADDSDPSLQSQTQMEDASGQTKSPQQKSSVAANSRAADDSDPSLQSQTQMEDASGQTKSPQQIVTQRQNENEILVPRLRRTKSIIVSFQVTTRDLISIFFNHQIILIIRNSVEWCKIICIMIIYFCDIDCKISE